MPLDEIIPDILARVYAVEREEEPDDFRGWALRRLLATQYQAEG